MYLGGLDVGSSGCKVTVYDDKGTFIENHYAPYDSHHEGTVHEIDASLIKEAVEKVLRETKVPLAALGITSFGETFVLLDENDNVIAPSMLYNDARGDEEAASFDETQVAKIACCSPGALYSLPKLMWVKKHRPAWLSKTKRICLMGDYVGYLLTGETKIGYSLAARTMGFDVREKKWSKDLFAFTGIDAKLLSEPVPDGTVIGVSDRFGLQQTKIVICSHDQTTSAIGAGALASGEAVDGSGSVECITPIFDELPDGDAIGRSGVAFIPFPGNRYSAVAFSYTGGTVLKWFRDSFGGGAGYRELDASVSEHPSGLLLLPHFAGAATPYMDTVSKGMIYGLSLGTTPAELYRAIMEGVAYEMKINLELLSACGIRPKRLLATGGGSKSDVWNQIKADILSLPITVIDAPEVGALGTIVLTALAVGAIPDLETGKRLYSREGKTFVPSKEKQAVYADIFEKYRHLYEASLLLR